MAEVAGSATPSDPFAVVRTRGYVGVLALAAVVGAPIALVSYGFLKLVAVLQDQLFNQLPPALGFHGQPMWWPFPLVALSGLLAALSIRFLPGTGGKSPADGFEAGGFPGAAELPGVFFAAVATLGFGAVLGPEAPIIAIGGGLAGIAVRLARRDAPPMAQTVVASAGSFAALSTLLGSPIVGAFLLMEASGLGGPTLGIVLIPGLLAAGIGTLIFVGMGAWTGFGTLSLAIPGLPHVSSPTGSEFGWGIAIGLAAAIAGALLYRIARTVRAFVQPRMVTLVPVVGLAIAGMAVIFTETTNRSASDVLFSGQSEIGPLLLNGATWSVGALALVVLCKGLAYGGSLSSFRGGPIFPSMFIGAAGGIAVSHLPGLEMIPGAAMGIGAMCAAMLRLPLSAVLLATLFMGSDGVTVMPLVIVAVTVSYVVTTRLTPRTEAAGPSPEPKPPEEAVRSQQ